MYKATQLQQVYPGQIRVGCMLGATLQPQLQCTQGLALAVKCGVAVNAVDVVGKAPWRHDPAIAGYHTLS
jgi:hypothetical protein